MDFLRALGYGTTGQRLQHFCNTAYVLPLLNEETDIKSVSFRALKVIG